MTKNKSQNIDGDKSADAKREKLDKSQKILLGIAAFLGVAYLWIWTEPEITVKDPWYRAYEKVYRGADEVDADLKREYLNEGGTELKALADKYPKHARVHYLLGRYFTVVGEYDSAIARQNVALSLGSGALVNSIEKSARSQIAVAYIKKIEKSLKSGDEKTAGELFREAIEKAPNYADLNYKYGVYLGKQKRYEEAAEYMEKAVQKTPKNESYRKALAYVYFKIGIGYFAKNELEEAEKYFVESVNLYPKRPDTFNNLGVIYTQRKEFDKAKQFYEYALQIDPNHADSKKNLRVLEKLMQKNSDE